jgi:diphthamide synthase subunit DPH2
MYKLYYLLYQIKDDKTYWIVNVDEDYITLKRLIRNVVNDIYYIVERQFEYNLELIENELERNHFRIFYNKKNDKLIYSTLNF